MWRHKRNVFHHGGRLIKLWNKLARDVANILLPWMFVTGLLVGSVFADAGGQFIPDVTIKNRAREILSQPVFDHFDHFSQNVPTPPPSETGRTGSGSGRDAPAEGVDHSPADAEQPDNLNEGSADDRRRPVQQNTPASGQSRRLEDSRGGESPPGSDVSGDSRSRPPGETEEAPSGSSSSGRTNSRAQGQTDTDPDQSPVRDSTPPGETISRGGQPLPGQPPDESAGESRPSRVSTPNLPGVSSFSPRGSPSLRGRDGIERPVRFAPKLKEAPAKSWWEDWFRFDESWGESFGELGKILGQLLVYLAYLAIAVVAGFIVAFVIRGITEWWTGRPKSGKISTLQVTPLADDHSPGEVASDVYLERAIQLAQGGNYRDALGQLVLGAMSAIERARWVRYRRGLTLHDYLRSIHSKPAPYQGLLQVAQVYEPIEFGRRDATEASFQTALSAYRRGFIANDATRAGD